MTHHRLPCLLNTLPITTLAGVGPKTYKKLTLLKIVTLSDLLFHLPLRYQNKTKIHNITSLSLNQEALIQGKIIDYSVSNTKSGKSQFICTLKDNTDTINLIFFNLPVFQRKRLKKNISLQCFGQLKLWGLQRCFIYPEFTLINPVQPPDLPKTLTPIYPTTQGLGQITLQKLIQQALKLLRQYPMPELLPSKAQDFFKPYNINTALSFCHCPPTNTKVITLFSGEHLAKKRLIFEELLAYQLNSKLIHKQLKQQKAYSLKISTQQRQLFLSKLSFSLTLDQDKASNEILNAICQDIPMNRLLQGDVGSGKTIIAALAIFATVVNKKQAALLVPTEILAKQQALVIQKLFQQHKLENEVCCLTSCLSAKEKKSLLDKIHQGKINIIIGTQAIFQACVRYHALALVIIDEQHRFGVDQRLTLLNKGKINNYTPHQLVMSATPIPRTLTMSIYKHLDYSNIRTLPKHRKPIQTVAIHKKNYNTVINKIDNFCHSGQQVYWVCPLINETEQFNSAAAQETFNQLTQSLPHRPISLLHGQLPTEEKNAVMNAFVQGKTQILVATTMIEVGLDIANANLMVIDSCERLGLAQLHQLRGRVGRSSKPGFCLLLYQSPLSSIARQRLEILRETNNGFEIAEKDWELRGTGTWLGTKQSGQQAFYFANLKRDHALFELINDTTNTLLSQPSQISTQIIARWFPQPADYAHV